MGWQALIRRRLLSAAGEFFTVEELPERMLPRYMETLKAQNGTAFVAVTSGGALSAAVKAGRGRRCAGWNCRSASGSWI